MYKVIYNPREIFQKPDPSGKSMVSSISFEFKDEGWTFTKDQLTVPLVEVGPTLKGLKNIISPPSRHLFLI